MKHGRFQGSVSVFLAYVLVFVLAVMFLLLEVSRVWGLEQRTENDVIMTGNSMLAEYSSSLWEEYGLLFLDGTYGNGVFQITNVEQRGAQLSENNLDIRSETAEAISAQTWNLYALHPAAVSVANYGLATDYGGWAFQKEAVQVMESRFTEKALKELYEMAVNQHQNEQPIVNVEETTQEIMLSENPIETVEKMKQGECLDLVSDSAALSSKQMDLSMAVSKRELHQGTYQEKQILKWTEKILFRQYLREYFPSYVDESCEHALDYEMEYLIAGKASDKENLKAVVSRLILLREIANLQYLHTDVTKQELVLAAATALGTATLTPELIPLYKQGLNAAWAYAESVSDVRLLLNGQKVKVVKSKEQWHTELTDLANPGGEIKQSQGLSYQEYLQILLWTMSDETLSFRAMDLIEANTGCDMNAQIYCLEGEIAYQGEALFSALVSIGQKNIGKYYFKQDFCVSYIND